MVDREKVLTAAIIIGLFGGLVGGPIASLADYYGDGWKRFWEFMIPECIGFICMGLLIVFGKVKKKRKEGT